MEFTIRTVNDHQELENAIKLLGRVFPEEQLFSRIASKRNQPTHQDHMDCREGGGYGLCRSNLPFFHLGVRS